MGRFKYLGKLLDRSYEDWPAVLHNISKARQVWGWLGKLLMREGAEPTVSEKIYRAVVKAVLLFGTDTWVLMETMFQQLEEAHVSSLRQIKLKLVKSVCSARDSG